MAVDTPARMAILGAGPIGLEAALYARFLGYDVDVYERGGVAENVCRWGHVRMFSPFAMNRSTLGLAALAAQDAQYRPPDDQELLSGGQWAERYLLPLSQTDLLADHLHLQTTVLAVTRGELLKTDLPGDARRGEEPFRILLRDGDGRESEAAADVVLDTTGVYGHPNWLGQGGGPAVGEIALRAKIEYGLADVSGKQREQYAGRHVLVVGSGYSAATSIVALAELAREQPETRITWVTRRARPEDGSGPIAEIEQDRLHERRQLAQAANACAAAGAPAVTHWPHTRVTAIAEVENQFEVQFAGQHEGSARFDRVIANVGYRPDASLYQELQVHACYASDGPIKLAAALLEEASADCLDQSSHGSQSLLLPEPNFYILGAKSYGRNSRFLVSIGLEQIRELFTIVGDRADLDLYAGAGTLL